MLATQQADLPRSFVEDLDTVEAKPIGSFRTDGFRSQQLSKSRLDPMRHSGDSRTDVQDLSRDKLESHPYPTHLCYLCQSPEVQDLAAPDPAFSACSSCIMPKM